MERWLESIYSDGTKYYVNNPYPKVEEEISISIRMYANAPVKAVFLRTTKNGEEKIIPMEYDREENGLMYRKCKITVYESQLSYRFYIVTEDKLYYYNQYEISTQYPDNAFDFKILVGKKQPKWVTEGVFYQIFPDRFYNGDPSIDVKSDEYEFCGHKSIRVEDFSSVPQHYKDTFCLDFYNGDLEGIKKKIPYLKKLGVKALYINPIFEAKTVHKYDCINYFEVDKHLGGNKALEELVKELHVNGMKIIIDVSINHTSIEHAWFKEKKEYYFCNGDEYKAWYGVKTLPTLNYTSKELQEVIYKGENSLVRKWIKQPYNIDGWRFDVADNVARNNEIQLNHEVWKDVNKNVKSLKDEAYIVGECWDDCDEYLKGDEWDTAMNYYGFARPIRMYVGEQDIHGRVHEVLKNINNKMTAKELKKRIMLHYAKLATTIAHNQFNMLDSHDTHRLHNNKDISFEEYRGAVIMMFTMPGTPCIYYGDELEIDGRIEDVEGCRYPMPWNKVEDDNSSQNEYYKLYSKLSYYKNVVDALKYGGFKIISDDDYVFAYARFTHDELWVTVCSTDDEEREVVISLKSFGKNHFLCQMDALDTEIVYTIKDGDFILKVKPHTSYLIGF